MLIPAEGVPTPELLVKDPQCTLPSVEGRINVVLLGGVATIGGELSRSTEHERDPDFTNLR